MEKAMKALAVLQPSVIKVVEIPLPPVSEYECLVKIRACGFCNCTDLEMIRNTHVNIDFEYPFILGHEGAGEIVQVGSKVINYHMYDRIVFPEGRTEQGGYRADAGHYSEYAVVRDIRALQNDGYDTGKIENVLAFFPRVFPKEISFENAAAIVSMRETYSAARNIGIFKGAHVLIYGDGPNGFGMSVFSHLLGAEWIGIVGHNPQRLEHFKKNGFADIVMNSHDADPKDIVKDIDLDFVIDTAGRSEIIIAGSHMVKPGGKVALYSGVHEEHSKLDLYAFANNVSFHKHFFPSGDLDIHDEMMNMIVSGAANPADFYSHIVPLDEFQKAIDLTVSREAFKVVVSI